MDSQIKKKTTFKRLLGYIKPYKAAFTLAIICMIGYSAIDTLFLSQIETLIDDGLTEQDSKILLYGALFVPFIFILRGLLNVASSYFLHWVGFKVVTKMRQQLFDHMMKLPVSFHDQHSTGDLISKITYDTQQVAEASSRALLVLIKEGAFVIGLLGLMFYQSWQLSLVFLVVGPLIAKVVGVVSKRFRKVSSRIQTAMGNVTTTAEQMINGHKVVVMHQGQKGESARFSEINNITRNQNMKLVNTRAISTSVIQFIASLSLSMVLVIASFPEMLGELSAGAFTTLLTAMIMLLRPLKQLTNVNSDFQRGIAAATSVFDILDEPIEIDKGSRVIDRAAGDIVFEDVTFAYQKDDEPALQQINFSVKQGKTLALVGRSGSGKSTISNLLTRFYDVEQGRILLDGYNINDYKLKCLRRQFALVSQNVTLFNDTIANNIAYGAAKELSREQITKAAEQAYVTEFTDNMPKGLDTMVGENGVMLSGGQRQRIAIARALLQDAPILILDEATSALDTESERHIQDALGTLRQNRTAIVIAHRLSTIENADEIIVMDNGEIVERGTHQQLLDHEGAYYQLHNLQFSGGA
ncbi:MULTISPECIES: lipid A export permease/ATP-binding protein MsbA [Idiomarina]|jgi:subfamily B ATP-binding cassette protein MsbA|uniref:Lipid A export permease/ATP-binding protein MsbA n=3 Tax=Idiomarina abyssalis TaxID=86102 RepID=A0A8I1KIM5_9GAMM|nr:MULTISPECIES: lipid A export permease/ATP-binding protein MsbA [Idiomarina]MAB22013.1 lipid A export permease/ATP-binding protein MsbA [Idiomarina sp.]MBH94754.1 lipid A export permease/ATP-binding protein MsbA [Idiomarina sp.]MBJ7267455.1 lipid A export permease/ATP-binding protein MsbA [Idiomarina abyssalis]MBJ7274810.1 lipid A export permease/ATP-binding protein MsbA [Idiomarina abyssalis]MBJ7317085.1 lipid A export permease/ATP-binding protein MsbA [Idiomarina abyssalis]|tara:strand:+ start:172 stop:1920 length:1749 start_codon:yes stop_codon:yes gene_type:complete